MCERGTEEVDWERPPDGTERQESHWLEFLEWFFSLFMGLTTILLGFLSILPELSPVPALGIIGMVSLVLAWRGSRRTD